MVVIITVTQKSHGEGMAPPDRDALDFLGIAMSLPIILPAMLLNAIAKFDPGRPSNEVPEFIAVRPITNGGIVTAKLAMAGISSVLTWLVWLGLPLATLAIWGKMALLGQVVHSLVGNGSLALILGSFCLLLPLWTWKNQVDNVWVGLTGSPLVIAAFSILKLLLYGALWIVVLSGHDQGLLPHLWHWMPWILAAGLALKLLGATAAFAWGLRRKAISVAETRWIVGGWLACGLWVAATAWLVRAAIPIPGGWLWMALGGFNVLPLAGLALAPLVLAGNRQGEPISLTR
jgi:hypothetical protein